MMKQKPPCKDCPDRVLACHDSCSKYLMYKASHEQELTFIREEKAKAYITFHGCTLEDFNILEFKKRK